MQLQTTALAGRMRSIALGAISALVLLHGPSMLGCSPAPEQHSMVAVRHDDNGGDQPPPGHEQSRSDVAVTVNGTPLSQEDLDRLAQQYGQRIPSGSYWYDRRSGAWGQQGGPTLGITLAGLDIGGELQPDASNGGTAVFINGRELPEQDVARLQQWLGMAVQRGHWWVDADGTFGSEGTEYPTGNLIAIARQTHASSSEGGFYSDKGGGSVMGFTSGGDWGVSVKNADGSFTSIGN